MACVMASSDDVPMGVASAPPSTAAQPEQDLEARAKQKEDFVKEIVKNLEVAIRSAHLPEEKKYLRRIINPEDPCFKTLVNLLTLPKYSSFVALRCAVLRAIQMILKVAVSMVPSGDINMGCAQPVDPQSEANFGMRVLRELVGRDQKLADKAFDELCQMVDRTEQALVACDAMLVLAELGPQAFDCADGSRIMRLLDLFAALPDRASELVEVAMRAHAWGGATREQLVKASINHDGGRYLGEVLLQMVNRGDRMRRLRAVKIYSSCFALPDGTEFLYTNDKRVLVEILERELPSYDNAAEFVCYADCYKNLVTQCDQSREHHSRDITQLFEDIFDNHESPLEVRAKCRELLDLLKTL